MKNSFGRIPVALAKPEGKPLHNLINLLNRNINPSKELSEEDVYIRAMYIVSDQVNSYGGRFPKEEHVRLSKMLIDTPVLVGHRKDKLPIGRTFHATEVIRNSENWVKSYFYWLRSVDSSEELADNIDGGVFKECSLAFTYVLPECSICGKDIRLCRHEPHQEFKTDRGNERCFFNYRKIESILETSLVYKGAVPNTSITGDLKEDSTAILKVSRRDRKIELSTVKNLVDLPEAHSYLIVPRYEGVLVEVNSRSKRISLSDVSGKSIKTPSLIEAELQNLPGKLAANGLFVGFRGRERVSSNETHSYLKGDSSAVRRLVLFLYPESQIDNVITESDRSIRIFPNRVVERVMISRASREIMTRNGVEIWLIDRKGNRKTGYLYHPEAGSRTEGYLLLSSNKNSGKACLSIGAKGKEYHFQIESFNEELYQIGRKFVATLMGKDHLTTRDNVNVIKEETWPQVELIGEGIRVKLTSSDNESITVQPLLIAKEKKFLFSRSVS